MVGRNVQTISTPGSRKARLSGKYSRFVYLAFLATSTRGYPTSNIHSLPVNVISQDTYYEPQDNTNYYAKLSCNYTEVGSGPCAVANVTWIILKLTINGKRAANNSGPPATFVVPEPGCVQHLKVAITPGQGSSYLYACRITDIAGVNYDSQTVSLKNYIQLKEERVFKAVPVGSDIEIVCPSENDKPPGSADAHWQPPGRENVQISASGTLVIRALTPSNAGRYECWLKGNASLNVRAAHAKSVVEILPIDRPKPLDSCTMTHNSSSCNNTIVTCSIPLEAISPVRTVRLVCGDGYEKDIAIEPEQVIVAVAVETVAGERRCWIYCENSVGASNYSKVTLPAHPCNVSGTEKPSLVTEMPTEQNNSKGNVNTVLISTLLALVGAGLVMVLVWIALRRRSHNEDGDRDASSKQSTTEDGNHSASTDQTVEKEDAEASAEGPTVNDEDLRGGAATEQPQDQGGGASTNENLVFELMEMHEDENQANRAGNATEPESANDGSAQRNESSV